MPKINTLLQMTNDELAQALKSLVPGHEKTAQLLGNSCNGANVVLCTEQGYRVSLHEVIVRRFTKLLDAFDPTGIEELRDPFGSLVIVLQEVQDETLQALAELLYTGECFLQSEVGKEALAEILALAVTSELSGSPDVLPFSSPSHEYQPRQTQQDKTVGQNYTPQSNAKIVSSDPLVSKREKGNRTELKDLDTEDSDANDYIAFENAVEVLCKDVASESVNGAENADMDTEGEKYSDYVEESETRFFKVDTCDQENLGENCESPSKQQFMEKSAVHQCEICNNFFANSGQLKAHFRIHTGEKPFQCSHCAKQFSQKNSVIKHERTHTGEKPFKCSYCDKRFANNSNVIRHERTHTGEKPLKCSYCDKWFGDKSGAKSHEITHTGEKPYRCLLCGVKFGRKQTLNVHMLKIHK